MQTIRKKRCKQYFVTGVLLLSLSANIIKGMANGQPRGVVPMLIYATATVSSAFINALLVPYVKYLFNKPQIIIRSSKDNSEKINQEMVFSDEVELKLTGFSAIAKKIKK